LLRLLKECAIMTNSATEAPFGAYESCKVPGLDPTLFQLSPEGLGEAQRKSALGALSEYEAGQRNRFLGYQANQYGLYGDLAQYLTLHLNNIGDPFIDGNFTVNSKMMERPVLDFYASLWNAKWPHDPEDPESYWGYVLTMGSTEGNLYGLWNARDYLAGKALIEDPVTAKLAADAADPGARAQVPRKLIWHQAPTPEGKENAFTPVAFYSEDTHYSIIKIMRILGIQTFNTLGNGKYPGQCPLGPPGTPWPDEVPSEGGVLGPGSIDVHALAKLVEFFAEKGYPILVCLNYGTTFKGAYDDVAKVCTELAPIFKHYGLESRKVVYDPDQGLSDTRTGFWIHVDGALGATYMPFVKMAHEQGRIEAQGPIFDFSLPYVHSISTSGHKWIGAPFPTGLFMTRVKYQLRPPSNPAYIGSPDTTLAGSRSGLAPVVLWSYLASHSHQAQIERALRCEKLAKYTHKRLLKLQTKLGTDLWVHRTPLSLAVLFRKPNQDIVFKYTLSCESLFVDGLQRDYAHVYMMENATQEKIDALIADLSQPGAFPEPSPVACVGVSGAASQGSAHPAVHVPHLGRGWR
jgi:histidine decarboxylase